jgi:hypothetical protein
MQAGNDKHPRIGKAGGPFQGVIHQPSKVK